MSLTKEDLQAIANLLQPMKEDMHELKEDTKVLKSDVQMLKSEVQALERKTADIELVLENVTNRNIKIIAEGHLDLSRKLHEALYVENEREIMAIRLNILENELQRIKEQLNRTA